MLNNSIALKPRTEALSSADFNESPLNNQEVASNSQNFLHNPIKAILEMIEETERDRQKRKQSERETNQARDRQEQLKAIKKAYNWKLKKAESLKLALTILSNKTEVIQFIPDFDQQAFLEVVQENFNSIELRLLSDIACELHERLNSRINEINSRNDMDLYYDFYTFDPTEERLVTVGHDGEPVYHYGADIPTTEMLEMQDESKLLFDLYCELNDLIRIEPSEEEIETLKQALAA